MPQESKTDEKSLLPKRHTVELLMRRNLHYTQSCFEEHHPNALYVWCCVHQLSSTAVAVTVNGAAEQHLQFICRLETLYGSLHQPGTQPFPAPTKCSEQPDPAASGVHSSTQHQMHILNILRAQ